MRNRKKQQELIKAKVVKVSKEEKLDLVDYCGIKDPTPYEAVKNMIRRGESHGLSTAATRWRTNETEKYIVIPHFWFPRETLDLRVRRDHVPYDVWERMGLFHVTEGNVVDYNFVRKTINELHKDYNIKEIGVDRWNATQLITDLEGDGFTMVPIGMWMKH